MRCPGLKAGLLSGNRVAIGRAISLVEQEHPLARALLMSLPPAKARTQIIGITGPPGAGKSTLIHALLGHWVKRGERIAVVAVDPSSPLTGGAILGDRVRMAEYGQHECVFIRSLADRGHLGGLTRNTGDVLRLLAVAGFDRILLETVGAGQSDVEIMGVADPRIVVCPPGLGDEVQALKAGILEIADILVVNKGDLPAAEQTLRDLRDMLRLRRSPAALPSVLRVSARENEGITELAARIDEHDLTRPKVSDSNHPPRIP